MRPSQAITQGNTAVTRGPVPSPASPPPIERTLDEFLAPEFPEIHREGFRSAGVGDG